MENDLWDFAIRPLMNGRQGFSAELSATGRDQIDFAATDWRMKQHPTSRPPISSGATRRSASRVLSVEVQQLGSRNSKPVFSKGHRRNECRSRRPSMEELQGLEHRIKTTMFYRNDILVSVAGLIPSGESPFSKNSW